MLDLGTLSGDTYSEAFGINTFGQTVGWSYVDAAKGGNAFLYSNGVMINLLDYVLNNPGWTFKYATGINDQGQICGLGTNPQGQTHGFLLTPTAVPEPSSCMFMGGALLACMAILLHRRHDQRSV